MLGELLLSGLKCSKASNKLVWKQAVALIEGSLLKATTLIGELVLWLRLASPNMCLMKSSPKAWDASHSFCLGREVQSSWANRGVRLPPPSNGSQVGPCGVDKDLHEIGHSAPDRCAALNPPHAAHAVARFCFDRFLTLGTHLSDRGSRCLAIRFGPFASPATSDASRAAPAAAMENNQSARAQHAAMALRSLHQAPGIHLSHPKSESDKVERSLPFSALA